MHRLHLWTARFDGDGSWARSWVRSSRETAAVAARPPFLANGGRYFFGMPSELTRCLGQVNSTEVGTGPQTAWPVCSWLSR
jgi:hypothetical protein